MSTRARREELPASYALLSLDRNKPAAVGKYGGCHCLALGDVRREDDRSVPEAVDPDKDSLHDPFRSGATEQR